MNNIFLSPQLANIDFNNGLTINATAQTAIIQPLSETDLTVRLELNETTGTQAADTAPDTLNNSGKLVNGTKWNQVGGQFGGVARFDGVNDYISLNSSTAINLGTHAKHTISLWFNVQDKTISNRKQVIYEQGGTLQGLNIYIYNGRLYVGGWNKPESNWQGTYLSTDAIESNRWHHVALVLDATAGLTSLQPGVLSGYLDGVKFGSGQGSQLWEHASGIGLGAINDGTRFHDGDVTGTAIHGLAGSVDQLRIYNRALTVSELGNYITSTFNSDQVTRLQFNEGTGTQAGDSAPDSENNVGNLVNGVTWSNEGGQWENVTSFDGVNDHIRIADSSAINLGTHSKRTVALWFNVNDKTISNRKQVIYEEGGATRGLNIYVYSGRLYVGGWSEAEGWTGTYLSTDAIASNTWHHITLVLDAVDGLTTLQTGAFRAYLDGVQFATGNGLQLLEHAHNIGVGAINEATQFQDGDINNTATNGLAGKIDDLQIYNRALTPEQIAILGQKNSFRVISDTLNGDKNLVKTINVQELLANDRGSSLTVMGVSNAVNATVSLGTNGNISFTPASNFVGNASFQYTVRDANDQTATATVTVKIAEAVQIGTNLAEISYYSSELPFIDVFKPSDGWFAQTSTSWSTGQPLDKDANGWVRSLPTSSTPTYAAALLNRVEGRYPAGKYVVLYDGKGTLNYGFNATKIAAESTPGRDVIDVNPTSAGILLKITQTDPDGTGDYIRNVRVIPEQYESLASTNLFNPQFLEKTQPFGVLRFMNWMKTNDSTQVNWSDRPTLNDAAWGPKSAPVEIMVQLANQLDADPWFNMPHQATDDYVRNFATYVKNNLEPGRKVYVEYSNEVWNSLFSQYGWVENLSSTLNVYQAYGQRTTQITRIWDEVFGTDKERVIGLMGAQTANPWTATQALQYADSTIDAITIAGYVGGSLGNQSNLTQIKNWIANDADGGLTSLFNAITYPSDWSSTQQWVNLSQQYNRPILAYEGGQHLVGMNSVVNDEAVTDLFIRANRDPRMGEVYNKLLSQWTQYFGGGVFNQFNDITIPSKWGSWGSLEYIDQASSPKYDSLINYINQHSASV